jgi:hypothetical protein
MAGSLAKIAFLVLALGIGPVCQAQSTGTGDDQDAAAIHTEMLGAPVYAADGVLIGEVNDISYDEEDQPKRIRMTTALVLGHARNSGRALYRPAWGRRGRSAGRSGASPARAGGAGRRALVPATPATG